MKISRQIKKFFIQEIDFDRSVCMVALSNSDSISTLFPIIIALPWTITYGNFHEVTLSNKKVFYTST